MLLGYLDLVRVVLVNEILYKTLASNLYTSKERPGKCREVKGIDEIDKVVLITQNPIGRTPRSNPATYVGVFDDIRDILQRLRKLKLKDMIRVDLVLMLKVVDVKLVGETV